jgi:hypothetical protein
MGSLLRQTEGGQPLFFFPLPPLSFGVSLTVLNSGVKCPIEQICYKVGKNSSD